MGAPLCVSGVWRLKGSEQLKALKGAAFILWALVDCVEPLEAAMGARL